MKFSLIFLIVACLHFSVGYKKEEQTIERDGFVETIVREEWDTVDDDGRRGRGGGRGDNTDTVIIIRGDNDNFDNQPSRGSVNGQEKTVVLNRFFNLKKSDYYYSIDQQNRADYKFDGSMGRVVAKREHFLECPDLVPITRISQKAFAAHALFVTAGFFYDRITNYGWKNDGLIGYGVLENGRCGANVRVRNLAKEKNKQMRFQTSNAAEFQQFKTNGFTDWAVPEFFIWDTNTDLTPSTRRSSIDAPTSLLTRTYNVAQNDFYYSIDQQTPVTLAQKVYQFDANMGRIVTKLSDFPDCPDLVPITRLYHPVWHCHAIIVTSADVRDMLVNNGWKDDGGVIGYGVLGKGKCGATVQVRNLAVGKPKYQWRFQTTSNAEYKAYKEVGYTDWTRASYYIWEA